MPQPPAKWLVIDTDRGIDQKTWLATYVSERIRNNVDRIGSFAIEVATAFEQEFPVAPARKLDKKGQFVRWETESEALERCSNRKLVCLTLISSWLNTN